MATAEELSKAVSNIQTKWANPSARDGVYGNILKSVGIKDLRCMNVGIEFTWPVCAIGGVNGSGKSTVLQACSVAYSQERGGRYYKLGDWVRTALPGETPAVGPKAEISYSFWDTTPSYTVPHTPLRRRWKYPSKTPMRNVSYVGIGFFAPRIERRDRVFASRSKLKVKETKTIDSKIMQSVSTILGNRYDSGCIHTVHSERAQWIDTLGRMTRGTSMYTEPHMGAGEQKIFRLVRYLEELPRQSLILLEEPEITLHCDAQVGLAWYLMSLSARMGHQIIVTTHSADLFDALPTQARILLVRSGGTVQALHQVPDLRAAREMSKIVNSNKSLILVEDVVASRFLREILRRHGRPLLDNSSIVPVGSKEDVSRMVTSMANEGVRVVGVRDPDVGESGSGRLFSLPGEMPVEQMLLEESNIANAELYLDGVTQAFDNARIRGMNVKGTDKWKSILSALASELREDLPTVTDRLTSAWIKSNHAKAKSLAETIEISLQTKNTDRFK